MNPAVALTVIQMILAAEPAVVQVVHDLLVGTGGESDQDVLTQDLADWQAIIDKAKTQLASQGSQPPSSTL